MRIWVAGLSTDGFEIHRERGKHAPCCQSSVLKKNRCNEEACKVFGFVLKEAFTDVISRARRLFAWQSFEAGEAMFPTYWEPRALQPGASLGGRPDSSIHTSPLRAPRLNLPPRSPHKALRENLTPANHVHLTQPPVTGFDRQASDLVLSGCHGNRDPGMRLERSGLSPPNGQSRRRSEEVEKAVR